MLTAGKPASLCRETRPPRIRPLPTVRSYEQMRFAGETACATTGKSCACIGGACFSLPPPACGRTFSHLRRALPVLLFHMAPALVPALDTVSQRRIGVETSLDTAGK